MNIIIDGGPRTEFTGNDIVVEVPLDRDEDFDRLGVTVTHEGLTIDVIESGVVVGTEAMTWDEITDRIVA
jgi:hypothetical protein